MQKHLCNLKIICRFAKEITTKTIEIMKVFEILKSKLQNRSTEDLKKDIKEAMLSDYESSIFIFSAGLDVLENRISKEEYELFENEL